MQLTGCDNGNEKRNATCAALKTSKAPTQDALLFISYSMHDSDIVSIYFQACYIFYLGQRTKSEVMVTQMPL